jgi:hypothetical protein
VPPVPTAETSVVEVPSTSFQRVCTIARERGPHGRPDVVNGAAPAIEQIEARVKMPHPNECASSRSPPLNEVPHLDVLLDDQQEEKLNSLVLSLLGAIDGRSERSGAVTSAGSAHWRKRVRGFIQQQFTH